MRRNTAGQRISAQLISRTDGTNVTTGTTTVHVTVDGTQSAGAGSVTHAGQGTWVYAPTQAETNGDHLTFTFQNSAAVSSAVNVYPSFPQTGDNFARLGAPVGASISADVAAVKTDTANALTRLPAALVSGRMDASVGAMATDVITSGALAASAVTEIQTGLSTLTSANVADAVWNAATASYGTAGTYGLLVETNLDAAVSTRSTLNAATVNAEVDTALADVGLTTTVTGRIDATISSRLATAGYTAPLDAAGTRAAVGLASANLDTQLAAIDDFVDTEVAAIKAVTDKLDTAMELDGAVYRFTINALEQAPVGGGGGATDWTADERTAIRAILGIPGSGTTPLDPTTGILDTIRDATLTVAGYVDTEVGAIKAVTDKLDTALELDVSVYRFTANALEQAPVGGGGGGTDWTADERTAIRAVLGIPTSGTTLLDPSAGILDTIRDNVLLVKARTDNLPVDPADASDIAASFSTVNSTLSTLASYVDTEVAAIKAKTDLIPAAPAAVSDIPTAIQNADALLARDIGSGTGAGTLNERTVRSALRFVRNRWYQPGGVLTVHKEDDTTVAWTASRTTDPAAEPITGIDPA